MRQLPNGLLAFLEWDGICRVDPVDPETEPDNVHDPEPVPPPAATPPNPPPAEDVSGLKSALAKERQRAAEFERRMRQLESTLGDLDPERLREMKDALQRQKELEDQIAAREAKLRQEYERDLSERTRALQKERDDQARALAEYQQSQAVERAFIKAGGDPVAFSDFYAAVKGEVVSDESGGYRIVKGGKTQYLDSKDHSWAQDEEDRIGQPFNLDDFMQDCIRGTRARFFLARNRSTGSGVVGGSGGTHDGDWRKMSSKEKMKYGHTVNHHRS